MRIILFPIIPTPLMKMALLLLLTLFASLCFGMHPTGDLNEDCLHCRDCERMDACDQLECSWCRGKDCPCRGCNTKDEKDSITINVNCGTPTGRCSKGTLCRSGDLFDCCDGDEQCVDGMCATVPSPSPPTYFRCPEGSRYFGYGPENEIGPCQFRIGLTFDEQQTTIVAYYASGILSSGDLVEILFPGGLGNNPSAKFSSNDRCPFISPVTGRVETCIAKENVSFQAQAVIINPTSAQYGENTPRECAFVICKKDL